MKAKLENGTVKVTTYDDGMAEGIRLILTDRDGNDTIEESENSYCSFPDGEYSTTHYYVSLLITKNA